MAFLNFSSRYNPTPVIPIDEAGHEAWSGWEAIGQEVKRAFVGKRILVVDTYPGVDDTEVLRAIEESVRPTYIITMEDLFYDGPTLTHMMSRHLTEDAVRGIFYYGDCIDFIDEVALEEARRKIKRYLLEPASTILIYGFGATLLDQGDIRVFADLTRWEIQLRYRAGMPNYKQNNYDDSILQKYKRGYFIEWRIGDRHKIEVLQDFHFYLDTNQKGHPTMIQAQSFHHAICAVTERPFRLVPYFDPGVWGGQWMKEVCNLNPDVENYAWSFDGVPEENSISFLFGDVIIHMPAINVVKLKPKELLGEKTFARFGAEFPIRFDLLDTMGGQNLSLQVHPTTDYIREKYAMPYTQDESYYMLDVQKGGGVYLGIKENIEKEKLMSDLRSAQNGEGLFPVDSYINFFPAQKHDHFSIPAGTIHCSSANCMVLEISATPYIFTYKLYDWNRVGLDGKPRPIHIDDGEKVINFDRNTSWVKGHLVNQFVLEESTDEFTKTKTGLHELEFIDTHVFNIKKETFIETEHEVSMWNLVEGAAAVIKSPANLFPPFTVHYAETFIIPASVEEILIMPEDEASEIKVLRGKVRF